ncbi:MAG: fasciclin domain-containing protein, partial [Bacteroidota bacterium]|nr:fasciclin domain-containing protein [Bacteroidota bacterium]
MLGVLSDTTKVFTVFLPNNSAFRVSGIPSVAVVNSLPLTSLVPLIQYHIIPGKQYTSADVPTTFPNIQLPSYLTIGMLPGTPLPLNMSTFPSTRPNGFWDNNIPVVAPDMKFSNGVVHLVAALVSPPSQVLKSAIYSNPNLTYFKAAIARADSGQTGLSKLDSLLGYAVTNMTVLAPSDAAFQTLIFGLAFQGYLNYLKSLGLTPSATDSANAFATGNGAVAAGPVFLSTNNISTAQVKGIMAYHFLATPNPNTGAFEPNIRAFSVNFSSTPAFYTTLVNTVYPPQVQPGVLAKATFTTLGPNISIVTNLQFTGAGTFPPGGAPYSGAAATATSMDNHCVNGVYYVIDKVLLPQ